MLKFYFKCINGLIDFDFKLTTNNNIHSHNTRTSKNLHLPIKPTQTGENKNQPTKPQMTSTTSITRLKTLILYQNFKDFSKETKCKKLHWKKLIVSYRVSYHISLYCIVTVLYIVFAWPHWKMGSTPTFLYFDIYTVYIYIK